MHFNFPFSVLCKEIQAHTRGINFYSIYGFNYFKWLLISTMYPNRPSAVWPLLLQMTALRCLLQLTGNHKVWISDVMLVHLSSLFGPLMCFEQHQNLILLIIIWLHMQRNCWNNSAKVFFAMCILQSSGKYISQAIVCWDYIHHQSLRKKNWWEEADNLSALN